MKYKLAFLFFLMTLALSILVLVMVNIVRKNGDEYSKKVLNQMDYSSSTIVAKRGDILDCNLTPIAESERVYILILDPKVILSNEETKNTTLDAVSEFFGLDRSELEVAVNENATSSYLRYGGKTVLTYDQVQPFEERQTEVNNDKDQKGKIKGVWFETEYRRIYPYNSLASKVIGFTTVDSSLGLWGIEKQYNEELVGTNGREFGYINDETNLERVTIPAVDGYNVVSTIDLNIQNIINTQMQKWKEEYGAANIAILAMDPNNGEVKAMVTDTDYDLNNPKDLTPFYSDEEIAAMSEEDKVNNLNQIWRNFIISNTFEPGSTAKPLTIAAALEEGMIRLSDEFDCNGYLMVGGYKIKCHNYAIGGCGHINLAEALSNSCNVALMEIGAKLGRTQFARYQQLFNLGQKTGIDLPGEASAAGLLYREDQLNVTELATNAFGQGFNSTMIQIAAAFSSVINGGNYYQPHVVKQLVDTDGNVVKEIEPVLVRETVSSTTSEFMKEALHLTVEEGTGGGTKIEGYNIGAKTGTAEKLPRGNGKYIVSIITAAPIEDPELVLYVVIDEPNVENQADSYPAQQLAGWIWPELMPYLGIFPDNDTNETQVEQPDDAFPNGESFLEEEQVSDPIDDLPGGEEEEDVEAGVPLDQIAGDLSE